MSRRTSLTNAWKTVGALTSPNGRPRYSKCPTGVLKAVFHSSPSFMHTRWYALRRSNFVKIFAPCKISKADNISGNGYRFLTENTTLREVVWCLEGDLYCSHKVDAEGETWPGSGWTHPINRGTPPALQKNHRVPPEKQRQRKQAEQQTLNNQNDKTNSKKE